MEQDNTKYWLWLVMVLGTANAKTLEIVQMHSTPKELYYVLHDPDCSLLAEKERLKVRKIRLEQAESVMAHCEKNGIGIMTWESELYPESLRHIFNPPLVLFYKGDPSILNGSMILTVVGTRRPSEYSMRVANWLCRDLARCNIVLASGCAVGLDAAAHRAAIEAGTPTIGVLGCGVDYDYPRENREMKQKIVQNGLLLSEYFPGTQPFPANFPVRNRILAGISEATLVLEAGARSGSLITANLACEQGKQVFCVPPADLFDARYSGVAGFLRDGAYPVFNYLDILYTYYLRYPHKLTMYDEEDATRTQDSLIFDEGKPASVKKAPARRTVKSVPVAEPEPQPESIEPPDWMHEEHLKILRMLAEGTQNINDICTMLGKGFQETSVVTLELELQGYIVDIDRSRFELTDTARKLSVIRKEGASSD
ncbi:MAG: DNA-processing protein DprA [Oscillospiraceae bacterium]|nr:DNA-processing protein DprA [Oscillospiraceae bacterium]